MKTEIVHALTDTFEAHAQQAENGIEFWLARDLQHLLGYDEWRSCDTLLRSSRLREQLRCASSRNLAYRPTCRRRNFTAVINKAKTACEVSDHAISDHFVDVNKMVDLGSGSQREVDDIMLTNHRFSRFPGVMP